MNKGLTIAGIDVSRNSITVCILSSIPDDLKQFKNKWKPLKFKADAEGIANLLALEFDGAVLEPTGAHYSRIWAHHLEKANRIVRWVGHHEVAAYRESWRCFNKTDKADAIALACYGLERWERPQFFITPSQFRIKELYQQLQHLQRLKNPVINRLRQQLCHEFPEVSEKTVTRFWCKPNPPGLWRAIAGDVSGKWQREIDRSIGTGISMFSRSLAERLIDIERQEYEIEVAIDRELNRPEFAPYLKVFKRYGIAERTSAALLSAIYPFSQFLGKDGKQIIDRVGEKGSKRYRSLSSFKLAIGIGMVWYQSGDSEGWRPGGRSDIRRALWQWCKAVVVMKPDLENEAIAKLHHYYSEGCTQLIGSKEKGFKEKYFDPGVRNQKVMRVVRRMVEMLYKDLLKEFS